MKTEPDVFSFQDLKGRPRRTEGWDGIRNYQARNYLRDEFQVGDLVFIYHSRVEHPAIVGVAEVVRSAYPDVSALDPASKYFDQLSLKQKQSRWVMVDVRATHEFSVPVTLEMMRSFPALDGLLVLKKGQRLSIQPVDRMHWDAICKIGKCFSLDGETSRQGSSTIELAGH
jgi:predicted RNA-binding protein with PUA-like domain